MENLVGKKFGKLTVQALAKKSRNRSEKWICLCDCGNTKSVTTINLKSGAVSDCGCSIKESGIIGKRFGRLVVVEEIIINHSTHRYKCLCDCGNEHIVQKSHLLNGCVKSCGCLAEEERKRGNVKHGLCNTRIWHIYRGILSRCYYPKDASYERYGGRGIIVCDEWLGENGAVNFYNWAINNGYADNLSIDRKNTNGNYEPSNCRWADAKTQQNNTRKNKYYEYNGEKLTFSQISEKYNISWSTLYHRMKKYNDIKIAIELPIQENKCRYPKKGE